MTIIMRPSAGHTSMDFNTLKQLDLSKLSDDPIKLTQTILQTIGAQVIISPDIEPDGTALSNISASVVDQSASLIRSVSDGQGNTTTASITHEDTLYQLHITDGHAQLNIIFGQSKDTVTLVQEQPLIQRSIADQSLNDTQKIGEAYQLNVSVHQASYQQTILQTGFNLQQHAAQKQQGLDALQHVKQLLQSVRGAGQHNRPSGIFLAAPIYAWYV